MRYPQGVAPGNMNIAHSGMMGNGFGIVAGILGFLLIVALITLIVLVIVKMIRHKGRCSSHFHGQVQDTTYKALEILNVRYANSEISDEEYQKKKVEISK